MPAISLHVFYLLCIAFIFLSVVIAIKCFVSTRLINLFCTGPINFVISWIEIYVCVYIYVYILYIFFKITLSLYITYNYIYIYFQTPPIIFYKCILICLSISRIKLYQNSVLFSFYSRYSSSSYLPSLLYFIKVKLKFSSRLVLFACIYLMSLPLGKSFLTLS